MPGGQASRRRGRPFQVASANPPGARGDAKGSWLTRSGVFRTAWRSGHRTRRPIRSIHATIPIVALAVLGASVFAQPAGADTASDLRRAKSQLDALVQRIDRATDRVEALRADVERLLGQVDRSRRALEDTQAKIVDTQLTIRDITRQMDAQQAAVDQRAARAYMVGPAGGFAELLGSRSFQDLTERLADLEAQSARGREAADGLAMREGSLSASGAHLQVLFTAQRAAQERLDADTASAESELALRQTVLDQLATDRATALSLVQHLTVERRREIQRALERARSQAPPPPPVPPGGEQMKVQDLIRYYFAPLGQADVDLALCVGWRESRYIPTAVNPASGAAGVFQFMPRLWPWFSSTAGWPGADVFDAQANVAVAAYTVGHFGWSPWNSDSDVCPI